MKSHINIPSGQLPKTASSLIRIRFPDCDPYNHLNNSRYLDYFINAREDHLLDVYHLDIHSWVKQTGLSWVVAQSQIAYLIPADIMETVTIETRLLDYDERSILLEGVMKDESGSMVKSVMWTRQFHYNLQTRKSQRHSLELMTFFEEIKFQPEITQTFEERLNEFKLVNKNR